MISNIKIVHLSDYQKYAPILAYWAYKMWYQNRDMNLDIVILDYMSRAKDDNFPKTLVALKGSLPIGMVSLKENDLWSRKDISPWLSSLYVDPDFRDNGVASLLMKKTQEFLKAKGYERCYLFLGNGQTEDLNEFYKNQQWKFLEKSIDNDGVSTSILYYKLPAQ